MAMANAGMIKRVFFIALESDGGPFFDKGEIDHLSLVGMS
jgi:hypothetical protein